MYLLIVGILTNTIQKSEVLYGWHNWIEPYQVLGLALKYDRPDVFIHQHVNGASLKNVDMVSVCYYAQHYVLRYMIENGYKSYENFNYAMFERDGFFAAMRNRDAIYKSLIARLAPKHIPLDVWNINVYDAIPENDK